MKIKILKDIPSIKTGEVFKGKVMTIPNNGGHAYNTEILIAEGYAEEVKEIDIEEIRDRLELSAPRVIFTDAFTNVLFRETNPKELQWFSSYRVVSEVIKQLNGDWVADWESHLDNKSVIYYDHVIKSLRQTNWERCQQSVIPSCKDHDTSQKVIGLCTPELLTLFNVK